MDQDKDQTPAHNSTKTDRREAVKKLGKFASYATPFTVLAFTQKAAAASGHGPGKHR